MPEYVLRNENSGGVVVWDIPEHQVDDFATSWAQQGWVLDKDADPNAARIELARQESAGDTTAEAAPVEAAAPVSTAPAPAQQKRPTTTTETQER